MTLVHNAYGEVDNADAQATQRAIEDLIVKFLACYPDLRGIEIKALEGYFMAAVSSAILDTYAHRELEARRLEIKQRRVKSE